MEKFSNEKMEAYTAIIFENKKFGLFHKACFHIHTPASHDYCLLETWDNKTFRSKSDQDILEICYAYKVFPEVVTLDTFDDNLLKGFKDKKELLSYLFLASAIIENNISIVIVADHHTISGVSKLELAIKHIYPMKSGKIYPEVLMGIEISCADRNHVVGIFDNNEKVIEDITSWLDLHLFNEVDGSFETSKEVLKYIKNVDGMGYIAHIDTSNTFGEKFLTGAYKKKLLLDLNVVGVSDIDKRGYIETKLMQFSENDYKFIVDNDSHNIQELDKKYMWVKGQKRNFQTLIEAMSDYDICMAYKENVINKAFIKGMYVKNTDDGYLCGPSSKESFTMNFSDELNSFIGGRGTGKSTVLELLEYAISQRCKSQQALDFLCTHGNTYILYEYDGSEYLIEMDMPFKGSRSNILQCFGQNMEDRYKYYYHYDSNEIKEYALKNHVEVFLVKKSNEEISFEKMYDKKNLLRKFFDTRYSVNELVNTAGGESINKFLYDILFENKVLSEPEAMINIRTKSGLSKLLLNINSALVKRADDVNAIIVPFNKEQYGILRIVYSQDNHVSEPRFGEWIWGSNFNTRKQYFVGNTEYNITYDAIEQYLLALLSKMNIFDFVSMVIKKDNKKAHSQENIINFCNELTIDKIEKDIYAIDEQNMDIIVVDIFDKLITDSNIHLILDYLKSYVDEMETFSLEFNINNRESAQHQKVQYKDVRCLSLGQKVVAMLTFILAYSDYSNDYRPLIIDQPEDQQS